MSLEQLRAGRHPGGVLVAAALESAGVTHTFGIPGTHNIELYDALHNSPALTAVLVTNEQSAGFMADGMSRCGGSLGCANVVPGAGITHLLSGVAEAWMDNVPLLVLTCGVRTDTPHRFQLHDVDQLAILDPVCKGTFRVERGEDIPFHILRAAALARAGCPGPVAVEIPGNHYLFRHPWNPHLLPDIQREAAHHEPPRGPVSAEVDAALSMLLQSKRPHFHLGLGAAQASDRIIRLVELLSGVVTTTFSGKGVFPENHPLWIWPGLGRACPRPLRRILASCDTTVILGARMGEVSTGSYGVSLADRSIHVDIDPEVPGANFPVSLPIVADTGRFVSEILERWIAERGLATPDNSKLAVEIASAQKQVQRVQAKDSQTGRVSPHRLFATLQRHFPAHTRYTTDSGRGTFLAAEHLRLHDPRLLLAPVDFSCMGYAVPAAIGAALARPGSPVVALPGDGAFLMTGLELLTAAQQGLSLVVFVLRDGELGQIARFQRDITQRPVCTTLPDFDLRALSAAVGATYLSLPGDEDLEHIVGTARDLSSEGRVVLVEVSIDYQQRTSFEQGVIVTNFNRLPWADRLRMVARTGWRRVVA